MHRSKGVVKPVLDVLTLISMGSHFAQREVITFSPVFDSEVRMQRNQQSRARPHSDDHAGTPRTLPSSSEEKPPAHLFPGQKFGGLKKRYQAGPRATIRCVDPINEQSVSFDSELRRENWLLRRFDPNVKDVRTKPAPLQVLNRGRVVSGKGDLLTTFKNGIVRLDVVIPGRQLDSSERFIEISALARVHGITCELRTEQTVRANVVLLDNLERIRQVLTTQVKRVPFPPRVLIDLVGNLGPVSREELFSRLSIDPRLNISQLQADVLLMHAYLASLININLSEVPYGPQTIITAV